MKKKKSHIKKKNFISLFCYSTLIYSKLEFIEYRDIKYEIYIILNIVDYR